MCSISQFSRYKYRKHQIKGMKETFFVPEKMAVWPKNTSF